MLDLSNSYGNGGRKWISYKIIVTSQDPNVNLIQTFLNNNYDIYEQTPISSSFLTSGQKYYFNAELCNFLGKCSFGNKIIVNIMDIKIPTINILGTKLRYITNDVILNLKSFAYIPGCDSSPATYNGLSYSWSISTNNNILSDIISNSIDITQYKLGKYSLNVNTLYTIQLIVTSGSGINQISVKTSVDVFVESGKVYAIINGGSTQSVKQGGLPLIIDASKSYDEDYMKNIAPLNYLWSCNQIEPIYSMNCGVNIIGNIIHESTISVTAPLLLLNKTSSLLTVKVTSKDGKRSNEASVIIYAIMVSSPIVSILSDIESKFNVNKKLILYGEIQSSLSGNIYWSVNDSSIDLNSYSLTPISTDFIKPNNMKNITVLSYLSLPKLILPLRTTLLFTLTCIVSSIESSASIKIITNGAPLPGNFKVTPITGISMNTSFIFIATLWQDEDIPLTYEFSFNSGTNDKNMIIQSRSENSRSSSILPQGLDENNNLILCQIQVFDSLLASEYKDLKVEVLPLVINNNDLSGFISSQLSSSTGNSNAIQQVLATTTSILNIVNCTTKYDCITLNRNPCKQTANTCGTCISNDYVGELGDANTKCELLSTAITTINNNISSITCTTDIDCGLWSACNTTNSLNKCYRLSKLCPGTGCSNNNGKCIYIDKITKLQLNDCKQGDTYCDAKCLCYGNYTGSDCTLTKEELLIKQEIRKLVLSSLNNITQNDDPSTDNILSWSNSLSSMSQVPDEIDEDSSTLIFNVASSIIMNSKLNNDVSSDDISNVINVLNIATSINNKNNHSNSNLNTSSISNLLNTYSSIITSEMILGQDAIETITDNFRMSSQIIGSNNGNNIVNTLITTPTSNLERLNNIESTSINLPNNTSNKKLIEMNIIQMDKSLYSNNSQFTSNPLLLNMNDIPCDENIENIENDCSILIKLQNSISINYPKKIIESIDIECQLRNPTMYTYVCNDGYIIEHYCNGSYSSIITKQCPTIATVGLCNSLDNDVTIESGCNVVNYTESYTLCSCPLSTINSNSHSNSHRHLQQSSSNISEISISYVAMFDNVLHEFKDTWTSAEELNTSSVIQGIRVLLTIGFLGIFVVCALVFSIFKDAEETSMNKCKEEIQSTGKKTRKQKQAMKLTIAQKTANFQNLIRETIEKSKIKMGPEERILEKALPDVMKSD